MQKQEEKSIRDAALRRAVNMLPLIKPFSDLSEERRKLIERARHEPL